MAHKKAGGSSRNGRDSESKRLGVKKFGGQHVIGGNIIIPIAIKTLAATMSMIKNGRKIIKPI